MRANASTSCSAWRERAARRRDCDRADLVATKSRRTGQPERRFKSFMWMTRQSWSRRRRSCQGRVDKGEANPRFVVTSLQRDECKAKYLYQKVYCARGEMENRIKSVSSTSMQIAPRRPRCAPTVRLWFYSMAYVLLCALRRIGLHVPTSRRPPAAPSVSSCSKSARSAHQRPPHQIAMLGLSRRTRLAAPQSSSHRRHRPRLASIHALPPRSLRAQPTGPRNSKTKQNAPPPPIHASLSRHQSPYMSITISS